MAERGCTMSYGPHLAGSFDRVTEIIFAGTSVNNIPIERPTHSNFILTLKPAKCLGLTAPDALLDEADEVLG